MRESLGTCRHKGDVERSARTTLVFPYRGRLRVAEVDPGLALDAYAAGDCIRIDIKDECGGLPGGAAERLFAPFTQADADGSDAMA